MESMGARCGSSSPLSTVRGRKAPWFDGSQMTIRLEIGDSAYALQQMRQGEWVAIALLPGGGTALIPAAGPLDEARLETAIQLAEDWLMPHAAALHDQVLHVEDATGRLRAGLHEVLSEQRTEWNIAGFEALFLRIVDLATGRRAAEAIERRRLFVADVLLVRELAHHGGASLIRLC